MKTLLVIDVQNDFLPGGALAVPEGNAVVPLINRMMDNYDLIVATQDWHPADHVSFASNHRGRKAGDIIKVRGEPQVLWPAHCIQRSRGAEFAPGLSVQKFARVFQKGVDREIDSYSGFFDNDKRRDTGLANHLHQQGVSAVDITGVATDYCVKATALDARDLGFSVRVLLEACRGVELNAGDVEQAVAEMRQRGVEIVR